MALKLVDDRGDIIPSSVISPKLVVAESTWRDFIWGAAKRYARKGAAEKQSPAALLTDGVAS
jgi:hypothetical protein